MNKTLLALNAVALWCLAEKLPQPYAFLIFFIGVLNVAPFAVLAMDALFPNSSGKGSDWRD